MIKKVFIPLLVIFIVLPGCIKDPDPQPQTIDSYQFYYNYLMEPYGVQWEIDDQIIGTGHAYGNPAQAVASLDQVEQYVLFRARDSNSGLLIDSLTCSLVENGAYMVAILGNEEEPYLLCEQMDLRFPSSGMTKVRFLHAAASMGPIDIYIGGDLPENKVYSGESFTNLSPYLEFSELDLWEAVIVTPANTLPADSSIISYTANTVFRTGSVYQCIIGHTTSSVESSYEIQAYPQSTN